MSEWQYVKLGDVCTIERGGSPRPIEKYITNDDNGINWIKIGDTTDSMYITKTEQKIIPDGMKKSRYVQVGDFLLSNSMSFGRPYILKIDGCIHDGWLVLRDKENKFDKRFLYYYLSAPTTYEKFKNMAVGGVVNNLNSEMVRNVYVPIPSLAEQEEIASSVVKLDVLIKKRKQQLQKLDELVKARFVEMFGNPVSNEKNWDVILLQDVCDGIGDGLHGTPNYVEMGEYPFINGNNLIDGKIEVTDTTKFVDEAEYDKYYIELSPNAVLLSINGTLGKLALYKSEKIVLGKSACYCNLKTSINRQFVYNLMQTEAFVNFLEENATKSTIKNVGLKTIRNFSLIMPPIELQRQFSTFAQQIDKSKLHVQKSLEKLETLKKSLMQKYFG